MIRSTFSFRAGTHNPALPVMTAYFSAALVGFVAAVAISAKVCASDSLEDCKVPTVLPLRISWTVKLRPMKSVAVRSTELVLLDPG
jgi:hypothetical protein